jgi:RNA polymerase sigma factor (sigma-70 family)
MKWAWKLFKKERVTTDEAFANCLKRSWSVIKVYTESKEFDKLYAKYYAGLFNHLSLKVNNHSDVEELINDTFIKMNENYILFDAEKGRIGSWIYGISENAVIDLYRKNKKQSLNVSMSEYTDENGRETLQIANDVTTDDVIERNETREMITNIINTTLTEKQRKVAELHFLNDYSYEEVREELQISMNDVKQTIRRTRIALQNAMSRVAIY